MTEDGLVPWPVFLVAWEALMGHLAIEKWQASMAVLIGRLEAEAATREVDKAHDLAFPGA